MLSVLSQDYPDIEYIVVDPGSTDGSRQIIQSYSRQLAAVVLDPDTGPSDGLNHGFSLASGDILGYLNADDALLPGAVREAVEYLEANQDVDGVYGDGYLVDGDGRVIRPIESSPFNLRRFTYGHVIVLQQATFMRRSAFDRAGGFNAANHVTWDGELIADLALTGGTLRHVRRMWGAFAIYPETISGSRRLAAQARLEQRRIFRKVHGREWRPADDLIQIGVRVEKWLTAPGTLFRRASGVVTRRSQLHLSIVAGDRVELTRGE
jgi:glycosyltransferase involved in cell wall biosynthesis